LVGEFAAKYPGSIGNSLKVSMADAATYGTWTYKNEFTSAPGVKELHIIVIDEDGMITKTPGAVLEKFPFCHKGRSAMPDKASIKKSRARREGNRTERDEISSPYLSYKSAATSCRNPGMASALFEGDLAPDQGV
jgi:hypothetical protein